MHKIIKPDNLVQSRLGLPLERELEEGTWLKACYDSGDSWYVCKASTFENGGLYWAKVYSKDVPAHILLLDTIT